MLLRRLLAVTALALAAFSALATPQARNATDMWYNAAESGWGLNLIHQGDTLFATLFVYGQDGQPRWYVASSLAGGPVTYTGPLFEATGPAFSAATFNPSSVTRRQVGAMTFTLGDASGTVDYTVDGVRVTKAVTRFTFRATNLTGVHRAFVSQPGAGVHRDLETFIVRDDGSSVAIDTSSDSESSCSWNGKHGQDGQLETVVGTFSCGASGSAGTGSFSMQVDPAPSGFVGTFSGGSATAGRIAAALNGTQKMEGTGWRNGMWFAPNESGWGVNVIEQGDTLFATLFVYDAQGRPHWYVASQLAQTDVTSDGTAINAGALFEATGPYFGAASFNPASVTRRQAGSMTFQVKSPGVATLGYTVDNVTVTKTVTNFAFRRNDPSGAYIGQLAGNNGHDPATITIADTGGTFTMHIAGMFGGSTCDYSGSSQQVGETIEANGTVQCGGTSRATFALHNLTVTADGLTGHVDLTNVVGFVQESFASFNLAAARTSAN